MKKALLIAIAGVFLSLSAQASTCGPKVKLDAKQDDRSDSVGVSLSWDLFGYKDCKSEASANVIESEAKARDANANADDQEIRNLERILRLCKTYGSEHPLLEGKCGGNIEAVEEETYGLRRTY